MEIFKDKEKRKGVIGTILFHLLLLLAFLLLGLTHIIPIPEQGIIIDFGNSEEGLGEEKPTEEVVETNEPVTPEEVPEVPTPIEPIEVPETMTQDVIETVEILTTTEESIEPVEVEEPIEEPKPSESLAKALEIWENHTNASASDGDKQGDGDMGEPDGEESDNYEGLKGPGGPGYSVGNRKHKDLPIPKSSIQEEGKVIVSIKVDRYGNVIWAKAGLERGSTITDRGLWLRAEAAAKNSKFTQDLDAPLEQPGTITYHFVLN